MILASLARTQNVVSAHAVKTVVTARFAIAVLAPANALHVKDVKDLQADAIAQAVVILQNADLVIAPLPVAPTALAVARPVVRTATGVIAHKPTVIVYLNVLALPVDPEIVKYARDALNV